MRRLLTSLAFTALFLAAWPAAAQPVVTCPDPYQGSVCYGSGDKDFYLVSGGAVRVKLGADGTLTARPRRRLDGYVS